MIDTIVGELANHFSHFPRTVGFTIAQVPRKLDVGSKTRERARTAGNGHIGAGDEHARANNIATVDRVAQSDITQGPVGSHVAHRRKSRFQHGARIGHGFQRDLRGGLFELPHRFTVMGAIGEVSVAIDKTGKHGHPAEIDDHGIGGNIDALPDSFNFRIPNEDDLVDQNGSGIRVYQAAGSNRRQLAVCQRGKSENCGED